MNGTYEITLPLPGGDRKSILTLSGKPEKLSGTLTNPYEPSDLCPVEGTVENGVLTCRTMVGRTEFILSGPMKAEGLELCLGPVSSLLCRAATGIHSLLASSPSWVP